MKYSISFSLFFVMIGSVMANSPYINQVYEYSLAPGQFINAMPTYDNGDNAATMAAKAEQRLANLYADSG